MAFNFSMSLKDEELDAAMEEFDFEDSEDLRGKIREVMRKGFRQEVGIVDE